jgi:outer membrane autotransporter protein
VTGGQLGVYAGLKEDQLHLNALFDAGLDNYSTQRQAMGGTANGSPSGLEWTGQVNAGFDWIMGSFLINPFVSGQYTQVSVNGFTEKGSMAPLTFAAQSEGYLASDLGASISRDWPIGGIQFSPNVSAAWEHAYEGSEDSLTANFGTGNNFTVSGPATGSDAAVLGAGLNAEFAKGFNLFASYHGKVGMTNIAEQSISGGINLGF